MSNNISNIFDNKTKAEWESEVKEFNTRTSEDNNKLMKLTCNAKKTDKAAIAVLSKKLELYKKDFDSKFKILSDFVHKDTFCNEDFTNPKISDIISEYFEMRVQALGLIHDTEEVIEKLTAEVVEESQSPTPNPMESSSLSPPERAASAPIEPRPSLSNSTSTPVPPNSAPIQGRKTATSTAQHQAQTQTKPPKHPPATAPNGANTAPLHKKKAKVENPHRAASVKKPTPVLQDLPDEIFFTINGNKYYTESKEIKNSNGIIAIISEEGDSVVHISTAPFKRITPNDCDAHGVLTDEKILRSIQEAVSTPLGQTDRSGSLPSKTTSILPASRSAPLPSTSPSLPDPVPSDAEQAKRNAIAERMRRLDPVANKKLTGRG